MTKRTNKGTTPRSSQPQHHTPQELRSTGDKRRGGDTQRDRHPRALEHRDTRKAVRQREKNQSGELWDTQNKKRREEKRRTKPTTQNHLR
jgi:hypothetical protein